MDAQNVAFITITGANEEARAEILRFLSICLYHASFEGISNTVGADGRLVTATPPGQADDEAFVEQITEPGHGIGVALFAGDTIECIIAAAASEIGEAE